MKKRTPSTRWLRYSLLSVILALVAYLALGFGGRSFEDFCPFGGVESLWGLYQTREFSCTLGPLNLSLLIGVLLLALVAKKAFCGWACPIGFLGELGARLTGLFWKKRPQPSPKVNSALKGLRYLALALTLYFTYKSGELILRGYDPFFLIFSGFGHGALGITSWIVLGALVAGALLIPMFFCRYLCPLGATLDPLSRLGVLKVVRNEATCTMCNVCQKKCPQNLAPQSVVKLRHRDCTLCLECVDACPVKDALELKATL
ncbi:MAG TPA: 4Fe-4S binding protein [bacterium]|jgi:polyferredoxin